MVQRPLFSTAAGAAHLSRSRAQRPCGPRGDAGVRRSKGLTWRDGAWSVAQVARLALERTGAGGARSKGKCRAVEKQHADSHLPAADPGAPELQAPAPTPSSILALEELSPSEPSYLPCPQLDGVMATHREADAKDQIDPALVLDDTVMTNLRELRALRAQRWERHVVAAQQYKAEVEAALLTLEQHEPGDAEDTELLAGEESPVGKMHSLYLGSWSGIDSSPPSPCSPAVSPPSRSSRQAMGTEEFSICTPCKPGHRHVTSPGCLALQFLSPSPIPQSMCPTKSIIWEESLVPQELPALAGPLVPGIGVVVRRLLSWPLEGAVRRRRERRSSARAAAFLFVLVAWHCDRAALRLPPWVHEVARMLSLRRQPCAQRRR